MQFRRVNAKNKTNHLDQMAIATVLVVHHEQQNIPSKQRTDTITVLGE